MVVINIKDSTKVNIKALKSIEGVVEVNIKENTIEITNKSSDNLDDIIMYF